MKEPKRYFDNWLKSQEDFARSWGESAKKLTQEYLEPGGAREKLTGDAGQLFFNMYNSWLRLAANSIPDTKDYNLGVLRDALLKSVDGSNVYAKLYEVWLPLAQAIENKALDVDSYRDFLDPSKYKEVLDAVFGFSPEAMGEFHDQFSKLSETWGISAKEFVMPWTEGIEESIKTLPKFIQGHPDSFMSVFHHAYTSFDKSFGRFLRVHAVGKDREKVELALRGIDDLMVYVSRSVKYQQMMYVTGLKAFEKVIETLAGKIEHDEIKSFNEFYDLWTDVSEKKYLELGRTAEYSKIQGELLDSALTVRGHYFKLMELYLYDVPVALRSEMDDLYKTVYNLKKKVKDLEKKIEGLTGEEAA